MEARYPGKDEYRYNIGEIGHDPHTLISYLTARYGDFKFDEIKGELETIFSLQYGITVEEKSETRQETSTIQVGQSLGNVDTVIVPSAVACGVEDLLLQGQCHRLIIRLRLMLQTHFFQWGRK